MAPGLKFKVEFEGYRELKQQLKTDWLLGKEWKQALDKGTGLVADELRANAPVESGVMKATVRKILQQKPVPMWGKATVTVTKPGVRHDGKLFRIGGALEGGRRYHYSRGPKRGQPTKGWWSGSLEAVKDRVDRFLQDVGKHMERRFNR